MLFAGVVACQRDLSVPRERSEVRWPGAIIRWNHAEDSVVVMPIMEDFTAAPNCVAIRFEMLHQGDCIA